MNNYLDYLRKRSKRDKIVLSMLFIAIVLILYLSVSSRFYQLNIWEENKERFFAGDTPMMTTLDAYKFTRHADEFRKGIYDTDTLDPMLYYPEASPYPDPVPLISVVIAAISSLTDTPIHNVAIYLTVWLAGLLVIPMGIYFYILGYPVLGILGSLVAIFAPMYAARTSIGRVDADSMIIFFMALTALFILLASRVKEDKRWKLYLFSSLAGFTISLFFYWYHHGVFNIAYLFILIFTLAISRFRIKEIAIAALLYILFSNPLYLYDAFFQMVQSIHVYIFPVRAIDPIFPDVYNTIGEAKSAINITESLNYIIKAPFLVVAGLISVFIFAIANFRAVVPLTPLLGLGLMTFVSSSRFSMFLGPAVGVGLGYIIHIIFSYIKINSKYSEYIKVGGSMLTAFLLFIGITYSGANTYRHVPGPSIDPKIYNFFKEMKTNLPKGSNILTWWDYGLAIADETEFKVFHSGMTQATPKTYLIAKALISDQQILYNAISYLDRYGMKEITSLVNNDNYTLDMVLNRVLNFNEGPIANDDYILYTADMVSKYGAISFLATWNPALKRSAPRSFNRLSCSSFENSILTCNGNISINVGKGVINNQTPLKATFFTQNGNLMQKINYPFSKGYGLIIDNDNNKQINSIILVDNSDIDSSFMQLYFINNPDSRYFELVMDSYPYARLYRMKKIEGIDNQTEVENNK